MNIDSRFRFALVLAMAAISSPAQVPAIFTAETPWEDRWQTAYPLAVDINRDGFLDVVVVGADSASKRTLATFVNQGGNGWVRSRMQWTDRKFSDYGWPALVDLDGDGSPEMAVIRKAQDPWFVPDFPAAGAEAIREADFRLIDSQALERIPYFPIVYGQGGNGYLWWSSTTPREYAFIPFVLPAFADLHETHNAPGNMTRLIQADFNMDGRQDAVALKGYSDGPSVYRRSGPEGYADVAVPAFGMWGGSHEVGDYDNDGDLDIVSSGMTAHTAFFGYVNFRAFFENRGDTLAEVGFDRDGPGYGACLLADLDNDGDLDLFSIGKYARTQIHRNTSTRKNAPPSVPQGLSMDYGNGALRLQWHRSRDDLTPSAGLTYNLRVGTAPDRGDVVMAAADPATGRLLTPHLGNADADTAWTFYTKVSSILNPLPAGRYYWTVQAVDNGYAASAFAPVHAFDVTDAGSVRTKVSASPAGKKHAARTIRPGRQRGAVALDGRMLP